MKKKSKELPNPPKIVYFGSEERVDENICIVTERITAEREAIVIVVVESGTKVKKKDKFVKNEYYNFLT